MKENKQIWKILKTAMIATMTFFLVHTCIRPAVIMSASMEPTLMTGEHVFLCSRVLHKPGYGDIAVFRFNGATFAKRVIGLPGDEIEFQDGAIYRNGMVLDEPYLPSGTVTESFGRNSYIVPREALFLLGDNRSDSYDSRLWDNPFVSLTEIEGYILSNDD